tara:strand:+ start:257 stop:1567 length:1311 start_codon:yes stop_codon:yes gene_type:complete
MANEPIQIGLLGLGTVGSGVANVLLEKATQLEVTIGRRLKLNKVLIRDQSKPRNVRLPEGTLTTDPNDIVGNPDIDVVVELLGGIDPARSLMETALHQGKHLVTANKEVMAYHGAQLLGLAADKRRDLFFEASVGGGIPLIGPFRQNLAANEITEIHAIINGTTNYILSKMSQTKTDLRTALGNAQELGFAEPDPTNDIDGHDAAYKIAILATLAFGTPVLPEDVEREGIGLLSPIDFSYAAELGYAIKLLGVARLRGQGIEVGVYPTLLTDDFLISQVHGVDNAVRIKGDLLGRALFVGKGAGPKPTASAIIADLIDLAHNIKVGAHARVPVRFDLGRKVLAEDQLRSRYYLRLWVSDQPGVLAQIAQVFADAGASIAAVTQKETDPDARTAELVILSHETNCGAMRTAVHKLAELDSTERVASVLRVEDLEDDE